MDILKLDRWEKLPGVLEKAPKIGALFGEALTGRLSANDIRNICRDAIDAAIKKYDDDTAATLIELLHRTDGDPLEQYLEQLFWGLSQSTQNKGLETGEFVFMRTRLVIQLFLMECWDLDVRAGNSLRAFRRFCAMGWPFDVSGEAYAEFPIRDRFHSSREQRQLLDLMREHISYFVQHEGERYGGNPQGMATWLMERDVPRDVYRTLVIATVRLLNPSLLPLAGDALSSLALFAQPHLKDQGSAPVTERHRSFPRIKRTQKVLESFTKRLADIWTK